MSHGRAVSGVALRMGPALLAVWALAGCRSASLVAFDATTQDPRPSRGVHYHPAKDVVRLKIALTHRTTYEVAGDLSIQDRHTYKREGTASLQTVADTSRDFVLDLKPGGASDSSLGARLGPGGLLESINVASTGRVGEAIGSLAKFAGSLVALGPRVGFASGRAPARGCGASDTVDLLPGPARTLVAESEEACALWHAIRAGRERLELRRFERAQLNAQIAGAGGKELAELTKKLALAGKAVETEEREAIARDARFLVLLEPVAKRLEAEVRTTSVTEILELADLPDAQDMEAGMSRDKVVAALTPRPPAVLTAFERTCAVVALGLADPKPHTEEAARRGEARIFFRPSQPARLKLLLLDGAADCRAAHAGQPVTRVVTDQLVDVAHTRAPVHYLAFDESAFAERKLELEFDAKGRPLKVQRSGKSDLASVTSALADSLKAGRDEYNATLKSIAEGQETRRKIELDGLLSRLQEQQKQKEVLDAELALKGAATTFEDALRKREVDARLDALKSEIALSGAEATAGQRVEIERLKAELELLKQQVELLKAMQDLERQRQK